MAYENQATDRALDWNEEISKDSPEFILLPEGDYPFEITKFDRARFDGSVNLPPCNAAILTLRVNGGAAGETSITHRLYLHSKCEGLLCAFFSSIGQRKHGESLRMNWNSIVGSKGWARIEIHEYTKKDGTEGRSNQVKRFLDPPEETAAQADIPEQWKQQQQEGLFN